MRRRAPVNQKGEIFKVKKVMRQMSTVLLAFVLAVCMLPVNLLTSVQAAEAVISNGIPPSIKGYWEYIGTDLDPTSNTV